MPERGFFVQTRGMDMPAGTSFSDQLEGWLGDGKPKTLSALGDVFGEKTFAVTILDWTLPALGAVAVALSIILGFRPRRQYPILLGEHRRGPGPRRA